MGKLEMSAIYFTDYDMYHSARRQYIDSLISAMIDLQSDPEIVIWIKRLRSCRDIMWDASVLDTVNRAMAVYNNRFIYYNGGGIGDTLGKAAKGVGKFVGKLVDPNKRKGKGFMSMGAKVVEKVVDPSKRGEGAMSTLIRTGESAFRGGDLEDMQSALRMELSRMAETEARLRELQ